MLDQRDLLAAAAARIAALETENAQLRAALIEGRDAIESWGSYASDYFQTKHDLASDLARIDALLAPRPAPHDDPIDLYF